MKTLNDELMDIMRSQGKLSAVKYYKDITGEGLAESKRYVDSLGETNYDRVTTFDQTANSNISIYGYAEHTRDHRTRYVADITHLKYGEHKIIKDYNQSIVEQKAMELIGKWRQREEKEHNAESAEQENRSIERLNNEIANLLKNVLKTASDVLWLYEKDEREKLAKLNASIKSTKHTLNTLVEPMPPDECCYPVEPQRSDFVFEYKTIHKILPFLKSSVDAKKQNEFESAHRVYTQHEKDKQRYADELSTYQSTKERLTAQLKKEETKHSQLEQEIKQHTNELIAKLANGNREAVEAYCSLLLEVSPYPIEYDKNVSASFDEGLLAIDYTLPSIDTFPSTAGVKITKGERVTVPMTAKVFAAHYDNALYQIALRSIYEVFADKYLGAVNSIVFNGWVTALNTSNGKTETNCIMSIKTNREQVSGIDFQNVNPKDCFKSLKGVASSQLSTITAIKPIVILNKSDRRFVEHYSVEGDLDDSTNLASMHWEDFEHLIRELFEQEFSHNGGEVKVTQTSRDGGVDAIAFDPDPIRGGKIVIQAKRYTNTVGVSAVRDLYGTVLNEGATKGILVTTSDYGGDSYEFAKDKPITLMNGSNLLYLLEKHGQRARIDIKEAKKTEQIHR